MPGVIMRRISFVHRFLDCTIHFKTVTCSPFFINPAVLFLERKNRVNNTGPIVSIAPESFVSCSAPCHWCGFFNNTFATVRSD